MTATSELNLSALWDLPSAQQDGATIRRLAAGSYVSTIANQSLRSEYGTYVTIAHRERDADQSRGQYVTTESLAPHAPSGTYISR